jgi:hypothetical protein
VALNFRHLQMLLEGGRGIYEPRDKIVRRVLPPRSVSALKVYATYNTRGLNALTPPGSVRAFELKVRDLSHPYYIQLLY